MNVDNDYSVEMNAFAKDDELIEQVTLGRHRRGADGEPLVLVGVLDELRALRSAPAPAMSEALTAALLSNTWDMRTEEDTTAAVAAARTRKGVPGYLPYAIGAAAAAVVFAFAGGGLPSKRSHHNYAASNLPSATTSPAPHEPPAEPTPAPTTAPAARQGGSRSVVDSTPTNGGTSTQTSTTPTPSPTPAAPGPTPEPSAPAPETTSPTLIDGLTTTVASVLSIPGNLLLG